MFGLHIGMLKASTIVFLFVSGVILYSIFTITKFHYDHYNLRSTARELLRQAHYYNDQLIMTKLWKQVEQSGIPLLKDEIRLRRSRSKITIETKYYDYFDLFGHEVHVFEFEVNESRKFK